LKKKGSKIYQQLSDFFTVKYQYEDQQRILDQFPFTDVSVEKLIHIVHFLRISQKKVPSF